MSEYPKTDKEIRMYCLDYIRAPFSGINAPEAVKDANTLYQFICPKRKGLKARLQELKKKFLEQTYKILHSFHQRKQI